MVLACRITDSDYHAFVWLGADGVCKDDTRIYTRLGSMSQRLVHATHVTLRQSIVGVTNR